MNKISIPADSAGQRMTVALIVVACGLMMFPERTPAAGLNATKVVDFRTQQVVCYDIKNTKSPPRRYERGAFPKPAEGIAILEEDRRGYYLLATRVEDKDCWVRAGQVKTDLGEAKAGDKQTCAPMTIASANVPGLRNVGEGCK